MTWAGYGQSVDFIVLGGVVSPGVATVRDGKRNNDVKTRKPEGSSGAVTVSSGKELAEFTLTLQLHDTDAMAGWQSFKRIIDAEPGGKSPKALDCIHPVTADADVRAVVVKGRSFLRQEDSSWCVDIYLEEYRKPAPKRARISGASDAKKPPEEDENDRYIRELLAQDQQLAEDIARAQQ